MSTSVPAFAPLQIGPLRADPPVVLAPMAGVTNGAFRALCRRFGAALYVSEMVGARAVVEGNERTFDIARFAADEPVRSIQLYGTDPTVMGEAVRRVIDEVGVDHIDLNFGCPARKITRHGGGAALPVRPRLFGAVVAAAVEAAGNVPLTVTMRVGLDDAHRTWLVAGRMAEDAGAAAVAVHARTAEQLYSGEADWSTITALKETVTTIPVLGNGDIWEASDAVDMMRQTGCDGVVIGRGCLGRPWLFRDLVATFAGEPLPAPPTSGEVVDTLREHGRLLAEWFGELSGMKELRKHTGWYLQGFSVGRPTRNALRQVSSLDELACLLDDIDPHQPFPREVLRQPRGHTTGPRPVAMPDGWLADAEALTPPDRLADLAVSGG
ncbi:MAG: tRNA dihydrouridine synthase DusB [Acidimicrobiales bacterium]|nr:tRNA dihydrouridine synthase DusB [Acidimicrobiales bacterium]